MRPAFPGGVVFEMAVKMLMLVARACLTARCGFAVRSL